MVGVRSDPGMLTTLYMSVFVWMTSATPVIIGAGGGTISGHSISVYIPPIK